MALGLSTTNSGGDFLPIVTYDARAGRMFKVDRAQDAAGGWASTKSEVQTPTFALDMGSIQVGWVAFLTTGPDFKMVPLGQPLPAKPSNDHKQGFRAKVAGKQLGGLREFSSSAKCVLTAIDALHNTFETAPEAATGKIPVVKMTGTQAIQTKGPQGVTTNYAPLFEVSAWTDRLPDMGERTVAAPGQKSAAQQAARGATHVPPPAPPPPPPPPRPAAAPELDDTDLPF